jgi:hypothetical protein
MKDDDDFTPKLGRGKSDGGKKVPRYGSRVTVAARAWVGCSRAAIAWPGCAVAARS